MAVDGPLRRIHRIAAILFLLSIPSAAYASSTGNATTAFVYVPLFPLLGRTRTGTYLMVRPWFRRWHTQAAQPGIETVQEPMA